MYIDPDHKPALVILIVLIGMFALYLLTMAYVVHMNERYENWEQPNECEDFRLCSHS